MSSMNRMWLQQQQHHLPKLLHLLLLILLLICSSSNFLVLRVVFALESSGEGGGGRGVVRRQHQQQRQRRGMGTASPTNNGPKLPLGDINVLILTDTHSWVGGHGLKEDYDINYGDVLSFYQLLEQQLNNMRITNPESCQHDLFFVMNGDWIDGTGLALNGDPSHLMPLLEKMPWHAVNVGNHELYRASVIESITRPGGFAEWWGSRYLSSNILRAPSTGSTNDEPQSLGNKFTYLKGRNSTVLTFGFLYNMNGNDPAVIVQTVQDATSQGWFQEALTAQHYDAILVLAHMHHQDSLINVILNRIRQHVDPDMPIQFVTGHTHVRGLSQPDNYSSSLEAGRYLDTIGFVSFPKQSTIRAAAAATAAAAAQEQADEQVEQEQAQEEEAAAAAAAANSTDCLTNDSNSTDCLESNTTNSSTTGEPTGTIDPNEQKDSTPSNNTTTTTTTVPQKDDNNTVLFKDTFEHVFIEAKYATLQDTLGGMEEMATNDGLELSLFIDEVQHDLGLFQVVGCIDDDYFLEQPLDSETSLWGLFCNHVVPHVFVWDKKSSNHNHDKNPKMVMLDKGSWRYDLLGEELIWDEVIAVSPFNDTLFMFKNIPVSIITALNATFNADGPGDYLVQLPQWILCDNSGMFTAATRDRNTTGGNHQDGLSYDLITAGFDVERFRKALEQLWPNASSTTSSSASNTSVVPEPERIPHHTTTSIWLQFVDETALCQTPNKGTVKVPPKSTSNNGGNHHHHHDDDKHDEKKGPMDALLGGMFHKGSQGLDTFRIVFVSISCCIVLIVLGIYIRQRSRIFHSHIQAQELASLQALEEYNNSHRDHHRYYDGDFINDDVNSSSTAIQDDTVTTNNDPYPSSSSQPSYGGHGRYYDNDFVTTNNGITDDSPHDDHHDFVIGPEDEEEDNNTNMNLLL